MTPFLSVCMIVKNEEKVLKRCLESIKDGVDEIIIVDTGSVDNTKKIASEYTNKVFDYQWSNSFSEARNFAQSKAVGQWILVMDADEFVDFGNLIEMKEELTQNLDNLDAFDVKIFNFTGQNGEMVVENYHSRIYKNDSTIKYYRTIHEQLRKGDGELRHGISKLVLYHSGYLSSVLNEKQKSKRNKSLIESEVKHSGKSGFDFFNMGNELYAKGETNEALKHYIKAYQSVPDVRYSWVGSCLMQLIQCLIKLNRYSDALNVIHDSEAIYSLAVDLQTMKARIYTLQGRLEDAEHVLVKVVESGGDYSNVLISPDYLEYFPNKWLGELYEIKGDLQKAIYFYSKALHYNFNDIDLLNEFFKLLIQHSSTAELYQFILDEKMLDNDRNGKQLFAILSNLPASIQIINQLVMHPLFSNDEGAKVKGYLLNNKLKDAFQIVNHCSPKKLTSILNEGIFDFVDFSILCLLLDQQPLLKSYGKQFKNIVALSDLLTGEKIKKSKITEAMYLTVLERTICLRQFELFEKLVGLTNIFDDSINIQIGHLLYVYDFCDLAIQFYQEAGPALFDEKTYVNLINESKKNKLLEAAFNFCNQAIQKEYYDFQILKNIGKLAHQMNANELERSIQQLALECYPDSYYLSEKTIWGTNRKKLGLVYTPLSGSNVTALMRQIPDEIRWKYQVNFIEQGNDLKYFEELLKNDIVVTTEGNYPFDKKNIERNQKVVELWHGFPLKSMGLMDTSEVGKEQIKDRWKNVDSVISYSELYNQSMKKCFGISENKFNILGAPRNDLLLQPNGKKKLKKLFNIDRNDRIIFYMPTWRHTPRLNRNDGSRSWDSLFDMLEFDSIKFERFLEKHHYKLIVKLHPADEKMFINHVHINKNIFTITSDILVKNQLDVYELLSGADLLITDYSSVYFDFLLLNKPIIFTPTDLISYQKSRGFILQPYNKWTPGPKVTLQSDLQNEIVKSMTDVNYYYEERERIKNIVHQYQDEHSTERVWNYIDHLL